MFFLPSLQLVVGGVTLLFKLVGLEVGVVSRLAPHKDVLSKALLLQGPVAQVRTEGNLVEQQVSYLMITGACDIIVGACDIIIGACDIIVVHVTSP